MARDSFGVRRFTATFVSLEKAKTRETFGVRRFTAAFVSLA
jgi:hypothetical protein